MTKVTLARSSPCDDPHCLQRPTRLLTAALWAREERCRRVNAEDGPRQSPGARPQSLMPPPFDRLGLTVLDRFRQLITEIGNAMGYVRMVRAGGLHYAATALGCAPGTVELPNLNALAAEIQGEIAAEAPPSARHPSPTAAFDSAEAAPAEAATAAPASLPLTPHSADAATNLTRVLERIHASFEEGATYFQKLESVFTDEMRLPKNSHLQTFFILVPALTINFVEHLLAAKDKLQRGQLGATFTDDGFAMGLAYLLNLLAQALRPPPDQPRPEYSPPGDFAHPNPNPNPNPDPKPSPKLTCSRRTLTSRRSTGSSASRPSTRPSASSWLSGTTSARAAPPRARTRTRWRCGGSRATSSSSSYSTMRTTGRASSSAAKGPSCHAS
eukprot:scaffold61469_cov44-Phaeocystis_antarctica.AAC.1